MRELQPHEIVLETDERVCNDAPDWHVFDYRDAFTQGQRADSGYWSEGSKFRRQETMKPNYINFSSPELALVAMEYMEQQGWSNYQKAASRIKEGLNGMLLIKAPVVQFNWDTRSMQFYSAFPDLKQPAASNFAEFLALVKEPVIKVGEHEVKATVKGAQVGCTLVPWDTVKAIAALAP